MVVAGPNGESFRKDVLKSWLLDLHDTPVDEADDVVERAAKRRSRSRCS